MAVGAVVARILTQYSDKGSKAAQKDINKLGKTFDDFGRKVVRSFAVAAAAAGAFAIKIGKDAVQAAIADQKSQVLLANSLRNTTGATNAAIASVESYISKLQLQVGVADDELRPALSKLAAVTGDVSAAQQLLGTALDVSAFSGADLNSVATALTRALQGNFRSLQKLVPSIDTTTIKSKDLVAIFREVEKATQGAAAARAGTLEYRLAILRIRYEEILETLGYALLPVLEEFSKVLTSEILPKIARWIELNKKGLAEGLRNAASTALELLKAAIQIGAWVVANFNTIKNFGILLASIWATGKVYAFVTAIGKVTLAFQGMQAAAAGAAVASNAATTAGKFGALAAGARVLGVAAIPAAAIGLAGYAVKREGNRIRANRAKVETGLGGYKGSPGAGDIAGFTDNKLIAGGSTTKNVDFSFGNIDKILQKLNNNQTKINNGKKKELSIEDKIVNKMLKKYKLTLMTSEIEAKATANAIKKNLNRQERIANSPTIQLGAQGDGSTGSGISGNGNGNVTVNITTPYGTRDDFFVDVQNNLHTLRRRAGMTPSGRMTGIGLE